MAFEEGLFYYLDNYAGLSREIDDRLYPLRLPQSPELPAVTYSRINTTRLREFENTFLPHALFTFNCWAENYESAKDVSDQIVAALDVYHGAMGTETVEIAVIDNERDMYDPETDVWHVVVDATIWWEG